MAAAGEEEDAAAEAEIEVHLVGIDLEIDLAEEGIATEI